MQGLGLGMWVALKFSISASLRDANVFIYKGNCDLTVQ